MTKTFHLGDILSITTGCFVSPNGVGGLYEILGWMTGDSLFTHQLPRAGEECAPRLLEQHPDLREVRPPAHWADSDVTQDVVTAWLDEQVARHGETREVAPLAAEDHTSIDPITELQRFKPGGFIVALNPPKETP